MAAAAASKTAKEAILDTLEDLDKTELEKFSSALCDRREEPCIRRSTIENKSRIEIADKLVTTFTEDNAVGVTVTILKKINCNNSAQKLEKVMDKSVDLDQLKITPEKPVFKWWMQGVSQHGATISPPRMMAMYDSPKTKLKSKLKSLQHNKNKCIEFEETYNNILQYNTRQVETTEKKIREEFEKRHQFLREEEKERVSALRKEGKKKANFVTRKIKDMQEEISSLSDEISAIKRELQKSKVSFRREQIKPPEPQLVSGVMIDVAKHLGNLAFRVFEKVTFSPVILDPNTANGFLILSEDLTSVRVTETVQELPDNPERFTMYPSVLGSEGLSSGKHIWEVEVGDHPRWSIGYAKKSVDRKGVRSVSPTDGVWCLSRHSMKYTNGVDYIPVQVNPQRVRVQLDYDNGKVSFYDTKDMSPIYTHEDTFSEKLYPFLNYENAGDAETTETTEIKVCQVECLLLLSEQFMVKPPPTSRNSTVPTTCARSLTFSSTSS